MGLFYLRHALREMDRVQSLPHKQQLLVRNHVRRQRLSQRLWHTDCCFHFCRQVVHAHAGNFAVNWDNTLSDADTRLKHFRRGRRVIVIFCAIFEFCAQIDLMSNELFVLCREIVLMEPFDEDTLSVFRFAKHNHQRLSVVVGTDFIDRYNKAGDLVLRQDSSLSAEIVVFSRKVAYHVLNRENTFPVELLFLLRGDTDSRQFHDLPPPFK